MELTFRAGSFLREALVGGRIFSNKLYNRGGDAQMERLLDGVYGELSGLSRRFWLEAGDELDVAGEGTRGVLEPTGTRRKELLLAFIPG